MILLDVDGVLAGSHKALIELLRNRGHDVSLDDITDWDFGRLKDKTGYSGKKCVELFWELWRNFPNTILPLDDTAVHTANHILEKYESEIVTANPTPTIRDWLLRVGISTNYFRISDEKTELEYTVLIEDNPTLRLNSHKLILRDQPWNQNLSGVTRFYQTAELIPILDNLLHQGIVNYRRL